MTISVKRKRLNMYFT